MDNFLSCPETIVSWDVQKMLKTVMDYSLLFEKNVVQNVTIPNTGYSSYYEKNSWKKDFYTIFNPQKCTWVQTVQFELQFQGQQLITYLSNWLLAELLLYVLDYTGYKKIIPSFFLIAKPDWCGMNEPLQARGSSFFSGETFSAPHEGLNVLQIFESYMEGYRTKNWNEGFFGHRFPFSHHIFDSLRFNPKFQISDPKWVQLIWSKLEKIFRESSAKITTSIEFSDFENL